MGREGKSADNAVVMQTKKRLILISVILGAMLSAAAGCGVPGRYGAGITPASGPEMTPDGVRFSLNSTKADRVSIAGDFNNWSSTADPLLDRDGTGLWTIVLPLEPGRYEYKFVLDGEKWIPDPGNPEKVDDGFGGVNSLVVVE